MSDVYSQLPARRVKELDDDNDDDDDDDVLVSLQERVDGLEASMEEARKRMVQFELLKQVTRVLLVVAVVVVPVLAVPVVVPVLAVPVVPVLAVPVVVKVTHEHSLARTPFMH